jgi:hypothetical protein
MNPPQFVKTQQVGNAAVVQFNHGSSSGSNNVTQIEVQDYSIPDRPWKLYSEIPHSEQGQIAINFFSGSQIVIGMRTYRPYISGSQSEAWSTSIYENFYPGGLVDLSPQILYTTAGLGTLQAPFVQNTYPGIFISWIPLWPQPVNRVTYQIRLDEYNNSNAYTGTFYFPSSDAVMTNTAATINVNTTPGYRYGVSVRATVLNATGARLGTLSWSPTTTYYI